MLNCLSILDESKELLPDSPSTPDQVEVQTSQLDKHVESRTDLTTTTTTTGNVKRSSSYIKRQVMAAFKFFI